MSKAKESVTVTEFMKRNKVLVVSFLLGQLMFFSGLLALAIGIIQFVTNGFYFDIESQKFTAILGLALVLASFVVKIPAYVIRENNVRRMEAENAAAARRSRQREMNRIRKSMTPGEWEMYKLQLENKKLLQDIKNKPTQSNSGPRAVYGFINEIGD